MTKETPAYVCSHVFRGDTVLLVVREDGDWQFLCGGDHDEDEVPHVVGLNHLLEADPSLGSLADLPDGWEAERDTAAAEWRRNRIGD